ncbi:hypothetical protein [Bdellovibrio svalbardensis]|uniref:Uncharacterized protein n=1 Tax=Bdellovibrio svalbardensis TaxID=2972972 RepID=A0ABT6DM87_9BACT|nr:hypothetical protein [Bdellovibrio svalbardensis]MDG0817995.1 hypothetical protein [Bdellovibrio svalbardensis]
MISKQQPTRLFIVILASLGLLFLLVKYMMPNSFLGKSSDIPSPTIQASDLQTNPTAPSADSTSTPIRHDIPVDAKAEEQTRILQEILKAKNDNDPRMDTALLVLSENTKILFRQLYKNTQAEKRNDRGTIVFLLGRNISNAADLSFFSEVLNERPCLSLADCSKTETGGLSKEEDEHQGGFAVSLAYPQLVTLHSLDHYLELHGSSELSDKVKDLIAEAKHSSVPEIAQMAEAIEAKRRR